MRSSCESEASDSDGELFFDRYITFIELYQVFERNFRTSAVSESTKQSFLTLVNHEEKFFSVDRYLRVLDAESRSDIVQHIKNVKSGSQQPSLDVFSRLYSRVWDKSSELLGSYQNYIINKHKVTSDNKSRKGVI